MIRPIWLTALAITTASVVAGPAAGQRLSERIDHVRQQRAQQDRAGAEQARSHTVGRQLRQPVEQVTFENTRAERALEWWSQETGIPLVIDWEALMLDGVDAETPIALSLRRVPANQLLTILLHQISPDEELIAEATPWYVEIMTRGQANRRPIVRLYNIMDLLHPVPDFDNAPQFDLESVLDDQGSGGGRGGGSGRGSGRSGGGLFGSDSNDNDDDLQLPTRQQRAEALMEMIRNTVEPELWVEHGGEHASIRYYHGHLIVSAPNYVHQQIGAPISIRPRSSAQGNRSRDEDDHRANAPLRGERRSRSHGVAGHQ